MNRVVGRTALCALLLMAGCSSHHPVPESSPAPAVAGTEVTGTLVAIRDDRPVDGGIELTLETAPGDSERVRVPSMFIVPPRDSIRAMHEVVDGSKTGDRLRARGTRDEDGALRAVLLERLSR